MRKETLIGLLEKSGVDDAFTLECLLRDMLSAGWLDEFDGHLHYIGHPPILLDIEVLLRDTGYEPEAVWDEIFGGYEQWRKVTGGRGNPSPEMPQPSHDTAVDEDARRLSDEQLDIEIETVIDQVIEEEFGPQFGYVGTTSDPPAQVAVTEGSPAPPPEPELSQESWPAYYAWVREHGQYQRTENHGGTLIGYFTLPNGETQCLVEEAF
jgi:hypothetical protein